MKLPMGRFWVNKGLKWAVMSSVTAIMTINPIIWGFGASVLIASSAMVSAQAATKQCTTEECACEDALRQNTIEALEAFLKTYPNSTGGGKSACAALGVPAVDERQEISSEDGQEGIESLSEDLSSGG